MIEQLLEKYFDGQTTCQEERQLREAFRTGNIPPHLEVYRPLFGFIDHEAQQQQPQAEAPTVPSARRPRYKILLYAATGIAACLLLALGTVRLSSPAPQPESFVIINGQRYTDSQLALSKAQEALQNVRMTDEDVQKLILQPLNID